MADIGPVPARPGGACNVPREEPETMGRFLTRSTAVLASTIGLLVLRGTPALAAPNPKPGLPAGVEAKLNTLLGFGMALVIVACVGGVFICAGKLAMALRHGE